MRRILLAFALMTTLACGFIMTHNVVYATTYQCDHGANNYSDPQYTFNGIRLWGAQCMQYPSSTTWGAIIETRSSSWAYIGAESQGWDSCGTGAWVSEFDAYSGQIWANYVTANGSGREEECDGLGHDYHTLSDHYITVNGTVEGFDIARTNP